LALANNLFRETAQIESIDGRHHAIAAWFVRANDEDGPEKPGKFGIADRLEDSRRRR
jgi:hypothetical protein